MGELELDPILPYEMFSLSNMIGQGKSGCLGNFALPSLIKGNVLDPFEQWGFGIDREASVVVLTKPLE